MQIPTPLIILFFEKKWENISLFFPSILMSSLYNFSIYLFTYLQFDWDIITYYTIYPFKVYNLLICSIFRVMQLLP